MKAIETTYKGYRFRSRLEAKWAIFFSELGLKWEYEPEGFDLGDGVLYLPDFRVTSPQGQVTWYEVKPENVKSDKKFELFDAELSRSFDEDDAPYQSAVLLSGDPASFIRLEEDFKDDVSRVCPRCGIVDRPAYGINYYGEMDFGCMPCDFNTPGGGENPEEPGLLAPTRPHKGVLRLWDEDLHPYFNKVRRAAEAARAARFEHGERERMARA